MNVPEEFTYIPPVPPTPVVVKRQTFELRNSKTDVNMTGMRTFEFRINQRTFVDLKSFYLTFDLNLVFNHDTLQSAATGTDTAENFLQDIATHSFRLCADGNHLFREIVLRNESGTVIERIEDVSVLNEIYKSLFASPDHLDTHGQINDSSSTNISSLQGYQKNGNISAFDRRLYANPTQLTTYNYPQKVVSPWKQNFDAATKTAELSRKYHCSVLKLLGFFQTGKVVRPSTFGGLTIEFKMYEDPYQVLQLNNIQGYQDAFTDIRLEDMRLIFDECIVDSAYEQYYNDNYDTRGFRLDIETVDYTSQTFEGNTALQTLRVLKIPFSVSNARALATVIRPGNVSKSSEYRNTTFLPPSLVEGSWRYQYVNMGGRYPLVPVDSFSSNIQEVNKFKRQTQTLTQDTMYTLANVTMPFHATSGTYTGAVNEYRNVGLGTGGRFMCFAHLERVLNSRYTGIPLDSNSLVLEVQYGNSLDNAAYNIQYLNAVGGNAGLNHEAEGWQGANSYNISSYVLYTSSVYVMNGQVSVTK